MKTHKITLEEFVNIYKPVKNYLNVDSSFDGYMFETYGGDLEFVKKFPDACWTLIEEDGVLKIVYGYCKVNRIGYFICDNMPLNPAVEVIIEDYKEKHIKSLLDVIKEVLNDFVDGDAMDGDEVDKLCENIKAVINKHEGNI